MSTPINHRPKLNSLTFQCVLQLAHGIWQCCNLLHISGL